MPQPPDDLQPLQLLALSRLLVAGQKGAERDKIQKDLEPLLSHRWSGGELTERLESTLEELASAGLLDRIERAKGKGKAKPPLFVLNDTGRESTLGALGLEALPPRTTWKQMLP